MKSVKIHLANIAEVKEFVTIANGYPFRINLLTEHYKIDAKSIMGVFSLDLTHPIILETDTSQPEDFLSRIQPFIVP